MLNLAVLLKLILIYTQVKVNLPEHMLQLTIKFCKMYPHFFFLTLF